MPQKQEIEIFDVTVDGLPKDDDFPCVFIWDGDAYTGWPLVDNDDTYEFGDPCSLEDAEGSPLDVKWEASEGRVGGIFQSVRFWFRLPEIKHTK